MIFIASMDSSYTTADLGLSLLRAVLRPQINNSPTQKVGLKIGILYFSRVF